MAGGRRRLVILNVLRPLRCVHAALYITFTVAFVLQAGCTRPRVPLSPPYREPSVTFFVAHSPGDGLAMDEAIAAALRARGFDVTCGPFEEMTADADVLVIYEQSWWQNILVRAEVLHLELRDGHTGATIAAGSSRAFSLIGQYPSTLAPDAVSEVFETSFD